MTDVIASDASTGLRADIEGLSARWPAPGVPLAPELVDDAASAIARLVAALEAGEVRAAEPDTSEPGGWRVNAWVKIGILLGFRIPGMRDYRDGPILAARDRVAYGVLDILDSAGAHAAADAGAPWRVVPGGTTARAGVHLEPGVTIMPPAYMNIGAWIGRGTMVDSHALVGSCAQIGARVHLSAAVQVGGVLEPAGARPVIVEDDAFIGGGCGLYDGVVIGSGAVLGAGVIITGQSRIIDLTEERENPGDGRGAPRRATRSGGGPRKPVRRRSLGRGARHLAGRAGHRQATRHHDRRARCPGGGAPMTATVAPPPPSTVRHPRIEAGASVAGLDPAGLVRDHGSPLYVYDLDVVTDRVAMLRAALPDAVEVAYAVKANPSPAILRRLAGLGIGADIASAGELAAVTRAGFDMRRVIFTGPGKTDAELAAAVRSGVRAITIESLEELDVLLDLAPLAGRHQGLVLRLTAEEMSRGAEGTPIIGAGGASKFGLLREELDSAIDRLLLAGAIGGQGSPYALLGLHAFGASNVRDADRLIAGIRWIAAQAEDVARVHGQRFRLVDAGGGLGIPYADDEAPLDLDRLGRGVAEELGTWSGRTGLTEARLLLEPGRFLVGPAGVYLTRIVRTKPRGGRTMAITDGGIHHLLRPALVGEAQRIVAVGNAATRDAETPASVVGPLCTGLDMLAAAVALPAPRSGDLLAVLDAGAYGFTESMPLFLSHPVPAEVAVSAGIARVARLRQEPMSGSSASIW